MKRCHYSKILVLYIVLSALLLSSCKKFIEIDPPKTEIATELVFSGDVAATGAIRGIYSSMMGAQSFTSGYMELMSGLSSDELINYSTAANLVQFYSNSLSVTNSEVLNVFWKSSYNYIYNANGILEGVASSPSLSASAANQLRGQALFIRAFCHFYLVNLFGDVPYITTTDYSINAALSRLGREQVYQNIIEDLTEAHDLLQSDFSFSGNKRVEPNKGAAAAMLARVYLYTGEWAKAEMYATQLIDNTNQYQLKENLQDVFLANSTEAIWQLMPVVPEVNTPQALLFIIADNPVTFSGKPSLSGYVLNSFEAGDHRKVDWVGSFTEGSDTWYYPYKYKVLLSPDLTEYSMVLRLAEQFLIRAEARAQQDKVNDGKEDLNKVRHRAGLENTTANDKLSLLTAIEQERKVELFSEWGHRWLDLKRMNHADNVLAPIKGAGWQSTDTLYPIPQSERQLNPNLSQNNGY